MSVSERQARYERLNMPEHRRRPATALFMNPGGQLTLGGRLRGEIYRTGVTNEGDVYSGEVVSPTEYAKYQEYGTSNNRAHPYMRPALYDMRTRFPQIVKKTMRRRPA